MSGIWGGVLFLVVFLAFSPILIKKLVACMAVGSVFYIVGLWVLSVILGAGKSGRNQGMLEEYAFYWVFMLFGIFVVMCSGVLIGLLTMLLKRWLPIDDWSLRLRGGVVKNRGIKGRGKE